ncbi:hypothetical protein GCM10023354_05290 [Garicola koreensis]
MGAHTFGHLVDQGGGFGVVGGGEQHKRRAHMGKMLHDPIRNIRSGHALPPASLNRIRRVSISGTPPGLNAKTSIN